MKYKDIHKNIYNVNVGDQLVYANGLIPINNVQYPRFGDTGIVKKIDCDNDYQPELTVKFGRCGTHKAYITCFFVPGSKASSLAGSISGLVA